MTASGRVRQLRPIAAPRSAASPHERDFHNRYANSSVTAITSVYIDSETSMPSLIHSCG